MPFPKLFLPFRELFPKLFMPSQELHELLQQCTVKLIPAESKDWGTGFFVAKEKIITCAHVVQNDKTATISVLRQGQRWATATVEQIQPSPIDLALLHVKLPEGEHPPCVLLDEKFTPFDHLYVYGYPDKFQDGGSVTIKCEGTVIDEGVSLMIAQAGQVRPGHSGSPALNYETGKVCGIVSETRCRSTDLGGLLIPVLTAFSQFPELREQNNSVHKEDRRWHDLIKPPPPLWTLIFRQIIGGILLLSGLGLTTFLVVKDGNISFSDVQLVFSVFSFGYILLRFLYSGWFSSDET